MSQMNKDNLKVHPLSSIDADFHSIVEMRDNTKVIDAIADRDIAIAIAEKYISFCRQYAVQAQLKDMEIFSLKNKITSLKSSAHQDAFNE